VPRHGNNGRNRVRWQVCLSVLLIGLVVYNPFLALTNHADGLSYQALARHRATVGATEMQHFSPMQAETGQLQAIVERIELVVEKTEFSLGTFQPERPAKRPELTASVWFRPPPTQ
jgi:hypothetical protein